VAVVTDANKNISVSSVTATELGYLSGVTSAIQTQIAGKAPAVHTHTKSDITDFPAYGNAAGTICEGNDSRLSDARTPVAHTHTKSDVTDLFNSANTWTEGNIFSAETYNNHVLLTNTTLDLSNGNPALSETNQGMILFTDKNKWQGKTYARLQSWTASDQTITVLTATYRPDANTESDFSVWLSNTQNLKSFHPYGVSEAHLGTSSYKWKTLNGINPGALSLPKAEYTNIDISAQGLNWDLIGGANTYTPTIDGWLEIWASRGSLASAYIDVDNTYIRNTTEVSVLSQAKLTVPVRNGQTYTVRILAEQCWVRIIKAEGNV
jgi:hypothetical protein